MANDGWAGWRLYPRAMPGAGIEVGRWTTMDRRVGDWYPRAMPGLR
jgi:hypothetical protein